MRNSIGGRGVEFTTKELAALNQMISVALLSGKIEFSEEAKSVHQKVTNEILRREPKR